MSWWWPFGPRVVVHRIEGLEPLADAVKDLAKAWNHETEVRGGFLRPPEDEPEVPLLPEEWVEIDRDLVARGVDSIEREDLFTWWKALTGRDPVDKETRLRAANEWNARVEAYELPPLDGREGLPQP